MTTMMWVCAAAAIGIFGVILHSVATFRRDPGDGRTFRRNTLVEIAWTLIPILIVVAAATPSFRAHQPAPLAIAASD